MSEVIKVVDTKIFEEKLLMAEAVLPFAMDFLRFKKDVAKFFNVHPNTITNWIDDGVLKENVHYVQEEGKLTFVPLALIKYKINPPQDEVKKEYEPQTHYKPFFS